MNTWKIAARNVSRQRRRAVLLGGAVALGAGVMILVDSLTNGMAAALRANVTAANVGELYVSGSVWRENGTASKRLDDETLLKSVIADTGLQVAKSLRKTTAEGTLVFGSRSVRLGVAGIPWEGSESALGRLRLESGSLEGMNDPSGIVIPKATADRLGVSAGESILVRAATVTGQVNVLEFVVAGILSASGGDMFTSGYARLERVNELVNLPGDGAQQVNLYLAKGADLDAAADAILAGLRAKGAVTTDRAKQSMDPMAAGAPGGDGGPPGLGLGSTAKKLEPWSGTKYSIGTLDEAASQFMTPVTTIKSIGVVVFAALLAICMVGVVNTFRMVLLERTREIGTMRAMGVKAREVMRLFLAEAVIMTGGGSLFGMGVAFALMPVLSMFRSSGGGMFDIFLNAGHLSFQPSPVGTLACLVCTVTAGSLAALFPARQAAALRPAVALRAI